MNGNDDNTHTKKTKNRNVRKNKDSKYRDVNMKNKFEEE